ncbi:MAG: hypothetical protein GW778_02220 [Alphaproteobacteria bacterium]|nr:hypothetical protein [Alphaproteobacteria bacterium]
MARPHPFIEEAARLNLEPFGPDATAEEKAQREKLVAKHIENLTAYTINPDAGDMTPEQFEARQSGVWTAELLKSQGGSRYNFGNIAATLGKTFMAVFSWLIGNTEEASALYAELEREERYAPREGSPIITNTPDTKGLAGAQADFEKQFANATNAQNLNRAPAPSLDMKPAA